MKAPFLPDLYLCASGAAFVVYGVDKAAARLGLRRVPERWLHLLGLACGWPGALLAQQIFRHKCSKRSFQKTFWALSALNAALCLAFLWFSP